MGLGESVCPFGATFAQCYLGSGRNMSLGKHRVKLMCVYSTLFYCFFFSSPFVDLSLGFLGFI